MPWLDAYCWMLQLLFICPLHKVSKHASTVCSQQAWSKEEDAELQRLAEQHQGREVRRRRRCGRL
jgi:hypothetical protein